MVQSEDQEEMDEEYDDTSAPGIRPEERLPIGWEKKIAAVDRKWFLGETCDFITDDELRTYVRTMGWSESSNANRSEWLKTILHGLDRALNDGPKEKRDRHPPKDFPLLAGRKGKAEAITQKKKVALTVGKMPLAAGVDLKLEAGNELVHSCRLVAAMQDGARLDNAMLESNDVVPNLLYSWLWFRRYILAYPERCVEAEASFHHYHQRNKSAWTVTEKEYPFLLRNLTPSDELVKEFNDHIDWFRELVLNSPEYEIKRWDGPLTGELGLKTKVACGYVRLRAALPGFVIEMSRQTWESLEAHGYTSLLQDRGHYFILFGPLSLVMDGKDDVWFGTVQSRFYWGSCQGSIIRSSPDSTENTRLIRLGNLPRAGEAGRMPRGTYRAGDEIVVRYSEGSSHRGVRSPSSPASLPAGSGNSCDQPNLELAPTGSTTGQPVTKSYKRKLPTDTSRTTETGPSAPRSRVRPRANSTQPRGKLQRLSALARAATMTEAAVVDLASESGDSDNENLGEKERED